MPKRANPVLAGIFQFIIVVLDLQRLNILEYSYSLIVNCPTACILKQSKFLFLTNYYLLLTNIPDEFLNCFAIYL